MGSIASTRSTAVAIGRAFDRRGLILSAGVAGVAAVAVRALPNAVGASPAVVADAPHGESAGYRATPHVLQYYQTAKA